MSIFLLLLLFLQLPGAPTPQELMSPEAQLARAEVVIAEKQKAAEHAVAEEAKAAVLQTTWHQQIVVRKQEKVDMIEKVKAANHLDASWTWDDAAKKFVQKK